MQPPPPPAAPPPVPQPAPPPLGGTGRPAASDPVRVVVGLLLVVPAAIGLLVGHVWPTIRTLVLSLQERSFLSGSGQFTGFDNYADVASRGTADAYLLAGSMPAVPLAALLVVAPLLAYAAHRAGRAGRWTARLVLAVPMVCVAPAAIAVAWVFARGAGESQARAALWLSSFGLVVGLGVTLFLAVLRGRSPGRSGWPAGVAVGAVAGIATVAVAVPAFAYPVLLGAETPLPLLYLIGFVLSASGNGAAHGTILFGLLLLLGVATALVVILSGLRLTVEPAPVPAPGGSRVRVGAAAAATGLGLVVVLAVTGYGLWPWLTRLGELDSGFGFGPSAATILASTWLPPLVSTVVGVGLAAAAGFGIGALRPLGRRSELLMLLFAPWLFVGVGPLVVAKYDAAADGVFGDRVGTLLGLVPPVWLVVPALFLFTVLFRGLADRPGGPGAAGYGPMVVAALPMLALVGGATWLVQSQSLLWSLVIGGAGDQVTGPVLVATNATRVDAAGGGGLGLVLPIPAIVVFAIGLGLLQVLYLDRLAVRVGPADRVGHNR